MPTVPNASTWEREHYPEVPVLFLPRCPACRLWIPTPDPTPEMVAAFTDPDNPRWADGAPTSDCESCSRVWFRLCEWLLMKAVAPLVGLDGTEFWADGVRGVVHRCPTGDAATTPCCGRSPLELPRTDRLTEDAELVTCAGRPVS